MAFQPLGNGQQNSTLKYIHVASINDQGSEDNYITNEETNHNQD
jgi:hypothetical protein